MNVEDKLTQLAVVDQFMYIRILGLSHWMEPSLKEEIYAWPSLVEFSRALVTNQIKFLEYKGWITTTKNYVLPKNKELCAAAGRRMMKEVLHELGYAQNEG